MDDNSEERSRKKRRLSDSTEVQISRRTLDSSVSPPPTRRAKEVPSPKIIPSPFQLTQIRDLPKSSNIDTVCLNDILGDPRIAECWEFNYLHDIDFLMDAFDAGVRDHVKVNVIHGFWKNEDSSRQKLKLQAEKYPNVTLRTAFMPEMFGTHHSKMLIVLRHDDTAQVIIHTANMIPFDWANMTQAVWRSPLLPKIPNTSSSTEDQPAPKMGSGSKFKIDLLSYLKGYDTRRTICKPLIDQLTSYDFSEVRAALVASVPGRQRFGDSGTSWGWAGLKAVLSSVPVPDDTSPEIVTQVSSIATLGPSDNWLQKTFFKALKTSRNTTATNPKFRIIFPTADEIRRSLNGYSSGNAIHTKLQSAQQIKQLKYLKPLFSHWAGDAKEDSQATSAMVLDAGRKRAAPHIKTYIRFADTTRSSIDWMLVTSANLSKQAWGDANNAGGDIRICSYEIGVLVWPELYGEGTKMVPTFKTDSPAKDLKTDTKILVGARMPYDLPLVSYSKDDEPWCASATYTEPDWKGETWEDG